MDSTNSSSEVLQLSDPTPTARDGRWSDSDLPSRDTSTTDDELIGQHLLGDLAAFDVIYQRHKGALYRFFLRQLNEAGANDAFQDIWIKVIDALPRYTPQGKFSSYLFTIAHNVLMDYHKKQMRSAEYTDNQQALDVAPAAGQESAEHLIQEEINTALYAEIKKLPINQRSVWILKQETNLSIKQIAELTSTSLEGAKSRLRYARETLKAGMQRYVRS